MNSVTIGLDIGSSAVRAAEIHIGKDGRRSLLRYAQVGLPQGWVVDGEINNIPGVAGSLRRLWSEGGFSSNEVVLGISGSRVFVRQADVPALSVQDLRSSLRFDAQELVPLPMDDAAFDFSVLGASETEDQGGTAKHRILLVAGHRDLLQNYVVTLKEAGLTATVMDAAPLALMRAVSPGDAESGVEVIVSIGAELTIVAVREGGVPKFIRTLSVGGAHLTEKIADRMHLELAVAERLKRGAVPPDTPQLAQAHKAMSPEMRDLAEEVRATVDFFVSQSRGMEIDRLLITGGGSQTEGLTMAIAGNLPVVQSIDPLAGFDLSELGYDESERHSLSTSAATVIGLALWPSGSPLIRLSLLPEEVAAAHRARRLMVLAGTGLAALAGLLMIIGGVELLAVHSAQDKAHTAEANATALHSKVSQLEAATSVHGKLQARAAVVSSALQGDVDWVRVLGQLAAVMPSDLSMSSFSGTRTTAGQSTSTSTSSSPGVGTATFTVNGTGGLPAAASWLNQLAADPDLSNLGIGAITVKTNGGAVQFSSNADLTNTSQSNRAKEVQK